MNEYKMSGNKGEWSELYVFFKLLSEGKVYAADENVLKIEEIYYPILKVKREEVKGVDYDYCIRGDQVIIEQQSREIMTVERYELEEQAKELLNQIKDHKGSFGIQEIEEFCDDIKINKIKAPSADTTDINLEIQDTYTNRIRNVGFSIKSELGSSPTLLNAGKTTNFIYEVDGLTNDQIEEINAINTRNKIQDKIKKMQEYGAIFYFKEMNNKNFRRNLIMIDSSMPEILANFLLCFYENNIKECKELIQLVGDKDPLQFGESIIYEYKFRKFLSACALGMKPAKLWDGIDEANGGYIIVKKDGEILAYHIYNRDFFEQYLLNNTICEKASTSRHDYMKLYQKNGRTYIKLNLQIRFK